MRFLGYWLAGMLLLPGALQGAISYTASYHPAAGNPGGYNNEPDFSLDGWSVILNGGLSANQWSAVSNLPFSFSFFGQPFTSFRVSANGLLTFSANPPSPLNANANLPASGLPDYTIACFWENFTATPPTGTNDQVQVKTFGNAPNRQFWIRWSSFEWGVSSFNYVAIALDESTGNIHLVDMYGSFTSNTLTTTSGVHQDLTRAVQAGTSSMPLTGAGSGYLDNSYYTFAPYLIPPQDVLPVGLLSPELEGCGMGQEQVQIRLTNTGQLSASGMQAYFSVDGGTPSGPQPVSGALAPGDTIALTFTPLANFSAPGLHTLKVWINTPGDGNRTNDTLTYQINHILNISSLPYFENFENGTGGWTSGGINSSWAYGTPAKQRIQGAASGLRAWVTNRTGTYSSFESSWVLSPCFSLSGVSPDTWIAMKVWWESEPVWDGAVLQATLNSGQSWITVGAFGAPDWYTSNTIGSQPGGQSSGWTGLAQSGNGSNGWIAVTHRLPQTLIGQPSVRFRVLFASNGVQQYDGFAFDDVAIGSPPSLNLGADGYYCQGHVLSPGPASAAYQWSTGASSSSVTLANQTGAPILDSIITVRATAANGLFRRDTLRFSMPVPLSARIDSIRYIACYGAATGGIFISVQGGDTPLGYLWSNQSIAQDLVNVPSGSYSVVISDVHSCRLELPPQSVPQSSPLVLTVSTSHVRCHGDSTGSVIVQPGGGMGGYVVSWLDGFQGAARYGMPQGTYQIRLTDAGGCLKIHNLSINEPQPITAAAEPSPSACPDSPDGRLVLTPQGGTPPYQALWAHGAQGLTLSNIPSGAYQAQVTDANQCQYQTDTFTVGFSKALPQAWFGYEAQGSVVSFRDSSFGGLTWRWSFGDGSSSTLRNPVHTYQQNGDYTVQVVVGNSCGADTVTRQLQMLMVGIPDAPAAGGLLVWPNPAQDQLRIRAGDVPPGPAAVELTDLSGRIHLRQTFRHPGGPLEFSLRIGDSMPGGLYQIRLIHAGGSSTASVSVQ